ncbi:aminotransferase class III-fold pyridoxal phosphate-dependent enzyme [Pseudonocardia sp. KRD291]|uniref:aminotransferase class III-fold pyridoxal phosphate-dependent enzyme n=1 Tax=Pseudonocardia sp. KRD291 TaxID=2792007 RepID=UPI001C4A4D95|nr:aminotransferase class III-fold pyridoxal phosphate-dependent enzyme [Pseudonocardia sp. KRD291]MBW0106169.1 aminotransferase class III-fold pyridoxal phosphate-dependent enzyme [Pseudonocardia sp. KRD291]
MTAVDDQLYPSPLWDEAPTDDPAGDLIGMTGPTIVAARGAWLTDRTGGRWLDARSAAFGPGHPAVTTAVVEQLDRVALSSRVLISRPLADAVTELARFCPAPLELSYLCNSGDEALDFALKLAKGAAPGRGRVLGIRGEDFGALAHGSALRFGRDVLHTPPLSADAIDPGDLERLPERLDTSTAAVVIAPAAPGRGLDALSGTWWRTLRRRCQETGALLVLDERLTAPARLGTRLGCQSIGIVPDVLVLGEQLGAGTVPLGVTVTSRQLYDSVLGHRNPTVHGSTFGANPLAAATVRAVLDAVRHDDLPARNHAAQDQLREAWSQLNGHEEVRAAGVDGTLAWIRFTGRDRADRFCRGLSRRRVLARRCGPDLVAFLPPLTSEPDDLRHLTAAVTAAVSDAEKDPEADQ